MATPGDSTFRRLVRPFERFFRLEASSSIVLLLAAVVALIWANSAFAHYYEEFLHTHISVGVGHFVIDEDIHFWVNDALMAIFFLLVGLEVKREFLMGKLSNPRAAAFPIASAIGGMVVPAAIYLFFNHGTEYARGWGVPMATDIAFALGILALVGSRVPSSLRVFLAAAAIVDDLGAVLVIAIFYTPSLDFVALGIAGLLVAFLFFMNYMAVRSPLPYLAVGVFLWLAVWQSGVHATIAGVLLALTIPARLHSPQQESLREVKRRLESTQILAAANAPNMAALSDGERQAALLAVEKAAASQEAPLTRLEHSLVGVVAFGIMPIFALVNAGVALGGGALAGVTGPVGLGIVLGLLLGKQIGMLLFPFLVVRLGLAVLPQGAGWRHVYGITWLGGIGFTVALFIAGLAFPPEIEQVAKISILAASLIAGIGGFVILKALTRKLPVESRQEHSAH